MHSRKDAELQDDTTPFPGIADRDATADIDSVLGTNGERKSWKRVCAAKRSIERYREQQHLKELLCEAYDEDEGDGLETRDIDLSYYPDDD